MKELAELERRVSAALARIGAGLDRMAAAPREAESGDPSPAAAQYSPESENLRAALAAEQDATRQLREMLAGLEQQPLPGDAADADGTTDVAALHAKIEELTLQVDRQGLEMQRLRQTTIQLRETLRALREQAAEGVEAHLVNRAILVELEALRAARSSEVVELDAILAELAPLLGEGDLPAPTATEGEPHA